MNVKASQITKLLITDVEGLRSPITFLLDPLSYNCGEITIKHAGFMWTDTGTSPVAGMSYVEALFSRPTAAVAIKLAPRITPQVDMYPLLCQVIDAVKEALAEEVQL